MNVSKAVLSFVRQTSQNVKTVRNYSAAAYTTRYGDYETIQVTAPCDHVLQVELHRPDKRNAMNRDMFREITACFSEIANDKQCRAVVVSGTGKMFTSGIDFHDFFTMMTSAVSTNEADMDQRDDVASKAKYIRHIISILQNSFNMMVKCQKPVISAVHSGCIGAGVDMISGTDIRYASQDVYFSVREVVLGLAADLGTLQRLPKIVGNDSLVREMAFTGRDISAAEAKEFGLISRVYKDRDETVEAAIECAKLIATKSPVAVQGTKVNLNYSRDHSEKDGLEFMQVWNMCMLQSDDLANSFAALKGQAPEYGDF